MKTVTIQQIARKTGLTDQCLYGRARREGWPFVAVRPKRYLLDSLPRDILAALGLPVKPLIAPCAAADDRQAHTASDNQKNMNFFASVSGQINNNIAESNDIALIDNQIGLPLIPENAAPGDHRASAPDPLPEMPQDHAALCDTPAAVEASSPAPDHAGLKDNGYRKTIAVAENQKSMKFFASIPGQMNNNTVESYNISITYNHDEKHVLPQKWGGRSAGAMHPEIKPQELRKAAQRAALVQAYKAALVQGRARGRKLAEVRQGFVEVYNAGLIYGQIRESLGKTSWQTLERWKRGLEQNGNDCAMLAEQRGRKRAGASKVTYHEALLLQRFLLHQHRFKIRTAIMYVKRELERRGIESPSSESTMRRWVQRLEAERNDIWTLMREGHKALVDNNVPTIARDRTLLSVGECLIADGHVCNFRVNNPWTGKPVRPVLIAWQDWRSAYICGWSLMISEDRNAIHLALQRAVLRLGRAPEHVYLDNGRAFKAKFFTDPDQTDFEALGLGGLYSRLGCEVHFAQPYNAQSKPVESFFKTFGLQFEKLLPSFVGHDIPGKPARMRRNEKFMRQLAPERVLEWDEAGRAIQAWLDGWYHATPHTGRGMDKQCPGDVFEAGRGQGVAEERLRFLLMASKEVQVRRSCVELFKQEYLAEELYGLKDQVVLRFDPHDLAQVHVYRLDGSFLCTAPRLERAHPLAGAGAPESADAFKQQRKRQQKLKSGTMREAAALARGMDEQLAVLDIAPLDDLVPAAPVSGAKAENGRAPKRPQLINPTDWADLESVQDAALPKAVNDR